MTELNINAASLAPAGFDIDTWLADTAGAAQFDLSHVMAKGMPIHPAHPPFHITLNNRHGDTVRYCGHSSANELMCGSLHSGTHIDALCHASSHGKLFGGIDAAEAQAGTELFKVLGAETIAPIFRRAVLLDVAGVLGVDALEPAYEVTAADLDHCLAAADTEIRPGDVVLLRSGWAAYWADSPRYLGLDSAGAPGPGVEAGRWLAAHRPFAVGSDTSAFEVMNHHDITLEVHKILIAEHGIHIIENLDLQALAASPHRTVALVALPPKIAGATGAPLRPIALA
ncbi:cyclase family protein [Sphingomonas hylomeconis]|uniref:Cyclase family protein n=1 Tax=Sphingomonas hylomeconis TaxID=1395958 RepID=A0ABV7SSW4_9SPHN|nr:cyclase family protein [Sphingomonas hylomeconis]